MAVYAIGDDAFAVFVGRGVGPSLDLSILKPHLANRSSVPTHYRIGPAMTGAVGALQIMRGRHLLHPECLKEAVGPLILADVVGGLPEHGLGQDVKPPARQHLKLLPSPGWVGGESGASFVCLDLRSDHNRKTTDLAWSPEASSIESLNDTCRQGASFQAGALYLWIDPPDEQSKHATPLLATQPVSRARWLAEWLGRSERLDHPLLSVEEMEQISRLAQHWGLVWGESVDVIEPLLHGAGDPSG